MYFLSNVLTEDYCIRLADQCINNYPKENNITSLHAVTHEKQMRKYLTTEYSAFLKKLRWTTLGYHYDWTNKVSVFFY